MIIPPELGYGEKGAGDGAIPGGATLHFIATLNGLVRLVLHICVIIYSWKRRRLLQGQCPFSIVS